MTTRIWMRRGLGIMSVAAVLSFVLWTLVTGPAWRSEFDWGARYQAAYVVALAPVLAAITAFDVGRRARPDIALLGRTCRRGVRAVLSPMLAVAAWAITGAVLGWALVAGVVVGLGHGLGPHEPWIFAETVAALVAAAAVGMTVAMVVDGPVAVAVAAGLVLLGGMLTSMRGPNLFQVATSSGTMVGIERTPDRALATIVAHGGIVLACLLTVHLLQAAHRLSVPVLVVIGAIALGPVIGAFVWPFTASQYRPSTEATTCVGTTVSVCGPNHAAPLLRSAAEDLAGARARLAPSGLDLPRRFIIARGDAATRVAADEVVMDLDSSQMSEGHLPVSVLASTLAVPHLCPGFFSDRDAPPLLERASLVTGWISATLTSRGDPPSAPDEVRQAFGNLQRCQVG